MASLLDGTTFSLCYLRDSGEVLSSNILLYVEMEMKRHHTTLVDCIIDETETSFQRPETWVFQLHLKEGRYLTRNKETKLACTCSLVALTTASLWLAFTPPLAFTPVCLRSAFVYWFAGGTQCICFVSVVSPFPCLRCKYMPSKKMVLHCCH